MGTFCSEKKQKSCGVTLPPFVPLMCCDYMYTITELSMFFLININLEILEKHTVLFLRYFQNPQILFQPPGWKKTTCQEREMKRTFNLSCNVILFLVPAINVIFLLENTKKTESNLSIPSFSPAIFVWIKRKTHSSENEVENVFIAQ